MRRRPLLMVVVVLAALAALVAACSSPPAAIDPNLTVVPHPRAAAPDDAVSHSLPPLGGYFPLKPVGAFAMLPDDLAAAQTVRRSTWEPRPENNQANHQVPPPDFRPAGYPGMVNEAAVFGRISGNFTGTTDEIIQWTAAKWGLPDDLIRAEAVAESGWYQDHKDPDGKPVDQQGYGDFGDCGGSPAAASYGPDGPSSFGIMQAKWCTLNDPTQPGFGGWPWTETSTAYSLDTYGAVIRACYEGWEPWLGNGYHPGDLWGCVGRWNAGAWYTPGARNYIARVQQALQAKPWLQWS
jgi:hypothetical protein